MKKVGSAFRFIVDKIKDRKGDRGDSLRFKNYYLRTDNDNRNIFVKIFDYLIWKMIIFCILFLFLYLRTNQLYPSVTVTSIIVIVLHSISMRNRNHKFQQMKRQKRQYIANRRVYNEIMNKTTDDMEDYIKEIFSPLGFGRFEFIECARRYILLTSSYEEEKVMILFNIYKNDFDVELKEVKEFVCTMTAGKIKKGIFVTTSDFTNDGYEFTNKLSKNYILLLINKKQLLKIIEQSNLFPDEGEIDEIIESKISRGTNRLNKYKKTVLSKNKIKGYVTLGIYLILASWYTPYTIYYITVASTTLALSLITFIFNRWYGSETEQDDSIDLGKLLSNV